MGVTVGSSITLEQNFPSLIIKIENTYLAVNTEISRVIYVRIIDN
jgi:ferrous iron transport protein A